MTVAPSARERRRARRVRWAVRLGTWLLRLLGRTWRVRQVGDAAWRARGAARQGLVLAVWHGDLLPAVWAHRGEGIAMLVSEHSDGEMIARIGAALGQRAVRGSTSRGASRALLALVRELRDGATVAITPDGPRGPRHVAQVGVAAAASKAGVPVVAIGLACSRAWTLDSWDRFTIPAPFARVVLAYGAPCVVGEDIAAGVASVSEALVLAGATARAAVADA